MQKGFLFKAAMAGGAIFAMSCVPASAQSVQEFYAGKTLRIIVSTGAASTYTTYAQLAADYLGKHLPGKPKFIVQNMPGAGGVRAANHMANAVQPDGATIAMTHETLPIEQVLKPDGLLFDMAAFQWIGVMAMVTSTLTVDAKAPATTIDGAKRSEVIVGSTGRGSITHQLPTLLNAMYGTKFRLVGGYQAMTEMTVAIERGELHGRAGSLIGWTQSRPKEMAEGKYLHMVQVNLKQDPAAGNAPLLIDLARNDREKAMLTFMSSSALVGRSLYAPQATPPERVKALRDAFQAMLKDPEFIATAKKRNHDILPASGEEVQAAVGAAVRLPKDIAADLRKMLE